MSRGPRVAAGVILVWAILVAILFCSSEAKPAQQPYQQAAFGPSPSFGEAIQYGALGLLGVLVFAGAAVILLLAKALVRHMERTNDALDRIPDAIRDSIRPVSDEIARVREALRVDIQNARCRYGRSPYPDRPKPAE